jgi:hypothetical protein
MTTNRKDIDQQKDSAQARADLLRRAEAQGIKPFASLEDVMGDSEIVTDFDVEAFLRQVRDDRDRESNRRSSDGNPGH